MNTDDKEKLKEVGYLIHCGLTPKLLPAQDQRYREAISTWNMDRDFKEMTEAILSGLGLRLFGVNDDGVVLGLSKEFRSVFITKPIDVNSNIGSPDDRQLLGLVLATIAGIFYTTQAAQDGNHFPDITEDEVFNKLVAMAEQMHAGGLRLIEEKYPDTVEVFEVLIKKSVATHTKKAGKPKMHSLRWAISKAFEYLEKSNFITKRTAKDGHEFYNAGERFRSNILNFGAIISYEAAREALQLTEKALAAQGRLKTATVTPEGKRDA